MRGPVNKQRNTCNSSIIRRNYTAASLPQDGSDMTDSLDEDNSDISDSLDEDNSDISDSLDEDNSDISDSLDEDGFDISDSVDQYGISISRLSGSRWWWHLDQLEMAVAYHTL